MFYLNIQHKSPRQAKEYVVDAPSGLLEFLLKTLTGMARNSIKSLLTRGEVSVGGKKVTKHDYMLKAGAVVRIAPPDDGSSEIKKRLTIVYEDDELIAIDKPAGMLSIATEREKTETAYHLLTDYVRCANSSNRIFVVHRLDRETSGIMIAAKNEKIKLALQDQWNELVKTRGYIAVAEGVFKEKTGTVTSWLKETKTHFVYSSNDRHEGQEAVTNYEVTRESAAYSLVKVALDTGRKNQIRVHLSDLGHPIAGDKKYGAATNPLKRLCLHANLLELRHPVTDKLMAFECAIPKGFLKLV